LAGEVILQPAKQSTRYAFIDAVRGLAATLVMTQHSLYASGLIARHEWLGAIMPKWLELGESGVVAFFLVSGFVIPFSLEKIGSFKYFWLSRATRIYPLYLLVYFATFAIQAGGGVHSIAAFAGNFLTHLLFVQEYTKQEGFVGGAWTLSLEAVWYLSISILFLLRMNHRTNLIVGAAIGISVLAQISCAMGHHLPMGRLSMLVLCVFGLVCYRASKDMLSRRHFWILFLLLWATIAMNLLVGMGLFPSAHPTATFQMAFDSWVVGGAVFFGLFFTRHLAIWSHSFLSYLGKISYSVYLLHAVVLIVLTRLHIDGLPLLFGVFAVTIGLATLTFRYIETPPIRWAHNKMPKNRGVGAVTAPVAS
jgi:peptidoglycan/LPS O-acetylase OafA/YrhL